MICPSVLLQDPGTFPKVLTEKVTQGLIAHQKPGADHYNQGCHLLLLVEVIVVYPNTNAPSHNWQKVLNQPLKPSLIFTLSLLYI